MRQRHTILGYPRQHMIALVAGITALIVGALAYDSLIDQVSTTAASLTGRHAKCGAPGPFNAPRGRPKTYRLMARLPGGDLIEVQRPSGPMPDCGATIAISQRVTPWGTTWYSTRD
jgi:hypothetical protein